MQVNNIQNHNTNFGMALKINPKLKPQLRSAHFATVERLQKIGKEVENVKLYDVCYENDIYTPAVRSAMKNDSKNYFAEIQRQEGLLGKPYTVTCGDDTYQGFNPKYPPIFETLYNDKAYEKYKDIDKGEIVLVKGEVQRRFDKYQIIVNEIKRIND